MVELVAERSYDAVTMRELTRLAGVSTRTFYRHYTSKEDCFLRTHDLIVRRLLRSLVSAQIGVEDWRTRVQTALHAFLSELADDPRAARVLLLEAYAAGPAAYEQAQRARRMFESRIGDSLDRAADEIMVPPLLIEGIVAGLASVVRAKLLAGRMVELNGLNIRLLDWALAYCNKSVAALTEITHASTPRRLEISLREVPSSNARQEEDCATARPTGDFALLLSAATKLTATLGASGVTVPRVVTAAGVARRGFYAHFESADDCLAAVLELQVDQALARAKGVRASSSTWAEGTCQAIVMLCSEIVNSRALTDICTDWPVGAGASGVRCRQRLGHEIARLLTDGAPPTSRIDELTAEATVGAILGALPRQTPHVPAVVPYLALAPAIGVDEAIRVVSEHAMWGDS
jgi:AcrR family transcriptional regulator